MYAVHDEDCADSAEELLAGGVSHATPNKLDPYVEDKLQRILCNEDRSKACTLLMD